MYIIFRLRNPLKIIQLCKKAWVKGQKYENQGTKEISMQKFD